MGVQIPPGAEGRWIRHAQRKIRAGHVRIMKTLLRNQKQAVAILKQLRLCYPNSKTELVYHNPFQLLVAVILSAQCTDKRVNLVTPDLFKRYPTPEAMAQADLPQLEKAIYSCGYYRAKAKALKNMSQTLVSEYRRQVPTTLEELVRLPGVGRKTASVIMNQAFGQPAIAVDTHVARLSRRLGWSCHTSAEKIEEDLRTLFPKSAWIDINGTLILHGRAICKARKPLCAQCCLADLCPSVQDLS